MTILKRKYQKDLRTLADMGLTNEEKCVNLLEKNKGDINLTTIEYINSN